MVFEKVQFPATVIADLYKHSLVLTSNLETAFAGAEVIRGVKSKVGKVAFTDQPATVPAQLEMASPVEVEKPVQSTIKFLGGFEKKVSILVAEHFHPHIADADLEFISKLLNACKLSLNDVAIVNVVNNPLASNFWELMPSTAMLLFDVDHGAVGLSFRRPHFEVQEWAGAQFMSAPALEHFRVGPEADLQNLKRKLWTGLQKIFPGK